MLVLLGIFVAISVPPLFGDHVYCVNKSHFGLFNQLVSEDLESCKASCNDVVKHTFYAFNLVHSLCACLWKKPDFIDASSCAVSCPGVGPTCGGSSPAVYTLYSYCPKGYYGKGCKKKCGCEEPWCTYVGSCASDSSELCKVQNQLRVINSKDYNPYRNKICPDVSEGTSEELSRAKDTVNEIFNGTGDILDALNKLKGNISGISNLGNDDNTEALKEVKSEVVNKVSDMLNDVDSNKTELLNLLKGFTDDVDEFEVRGNNPVDMIKNMLDNPNTTVEMNEKNVKLVTDIISNVLENSVINDKDSPKTKELYEKANNLINDIGKKIMKDMSPNQTMVLDTKMFTTKFVKTLNDTDLKFDGEHGSTIIGLKTNGSGTDPIDIQVTKFKGPKVGGKTSSDVFDVKVRSGDDDISDLGENQIEYTSTPKIDLNETHVTRFNLTTNNSIPNFLNFMVSSGSMLRLGVNLYFITSEKESGRTRGAFVISACELKESDVLYKLLSKIYDNCYDIYVKKLNFYRTHVENATVDIPFLLVSGLKKLSLIFDFVSMHDATIMVELRTFSFSCVFMNPNASGWESGCTLNDRILAEKMEVKCSCRHLTLFSTLASMSPNNVDLTKSLKKGLGTYLGVYIVITIWAISIVICFMAQWLDNRANLMRRPIDLADNKPASLQIYMLVVNTGYSISAGSKSEIFIMLIGTRGISSPHCLTCKKFTVLQTGNRNIFLLRVKKGLGDILKIRLWHHGDGINNNWFVKDVLVIDMESSKRYFFLCKYWLGPISGDEASDVSFLENKMALYDSRYLLEHNMLSGMLSQHPLISVFLLPTGEFTFTRLERAAVVGTRVIGYFMCSLMLFGVTFGRENEMDFFWGISYTLADVTTAFYNTLILMPVSLTIEFLFSHSRRSLPNPMIICDWRVDTEEGIPSIEYEEIREGEENEATEIDEVPETLPACSIYLAWSMVLGSALLFSSLFLLYTMEFGERKTYSWYYNSFVPTILGFVVEDIFSFVGLSLMATFFSKERIEPRFYFMNAIKWNCILSLANISENDLEGIKSQRKNVKYKPPEPVIKPIDFKMIFNKLIVNMLCLCLIILLCILAINTFHETSGVCRSVESALRVYIDERFMNNITTKDDFWKWLDDVYVKQFYGNNMAKILSTTNKDVTRFDYLQTSINASYMIEKPCVTRIPAQRVWWNVYMSKELAINGERYCMGVFKNLAIETNKVLKRLSWLHNGMLGVGVESTLYMPSADSIVKMFVIFEMTYGGGLTTLCKISGLNLFTGRVLLIVVTGIFIFLASVIIIGFHTYAALYYANTKPKKLPLIYVLVALTFANLCLSVYCFNAEEAAFSLVTTYKQEQYNTSMSFNMTMRLGLFLILFVSTYQLMGCVNNFLDEESFVVVCVNCLFYCLFDLIQLLLLFIPMYLVLVYILFRQFSRYTGMLNSLSKCLAFLSALQLGGVGFDDAIKTTDTRSVILGFTISLCLLKIFRLLSAAIVLAKFKQKMNLKEHRQNRLPTEVILLRFLTKEDALIRARKIVEYRRKKMLAAQ